MNPNLPNLFPLNRILIANPKLNITLRSTLEVPKKTQKTNHLNRNRVRLQWMRRTIGGYREITW